MIRRSVAVAALAIALVMTTKGAEATPIFSNYGPGNDYDSGIATLLGVLEASSFTAGTDASLLSISLSLEHLAGPNALVNVYLAADAAGTPGAIIESFLGVTVTALSDLVDSPPVTIMSTLHPALHSGVIYWVAAREVIAPGGFTSATWGWNSTGDTGTAFSFGGFAGPWATNMSTANAFSVEGTDVEAVPEPASMLLFGTGITGLIARRIRRRRL